MHRLLITMLLISATSVAAETIDGEEFSDPTKPLFYVENADVVEQIFRTVVPPSYNISFIRAGGESSVAVINDVRVSVGDIIGGAEVLVINREGVTLLIDDEERVISMYGNSIKSVSGDL